MHPLYDQIQALLTPEVLSTLKPDDRVDLVRLISGAVFRKHDYETDELINEAMEPYRETYWEPNDDGDSGDCTEDDLSTPCD